MHPGAIFAANVGTYSESEATLTEPLLAQLVPGMLLTADRGFFSYALWRKAISTGADLLGWVRTDSAGPKPTHLQDLSDGSWLAHLGRKTDSCQLNQPVRAGSHRSSMRPNFHAAAASAQTIANRATTR